MSDNDDMNIDEGTSALLHHITVSHHPSGSGVLRRRGRGFRNGAGMLFANHAPQCAGLT